MRTQDGYPWLKQKPMLGYGLDRSHPLAAGLLYAALFNEGCGRAYDLLRGVATDTTAPSWSSGSGGQQANGWVASSGATAHLNLTSGMTAASGFYISGTSTAFPATFARQSYSNKSVNAGWSLGVRATSDGFPGYNFSLFNNNGFANSEFNSNTVTAGDHVLVGTTDGVTKRLYVDGVQKNSSTSANVVCASAPSATLTGAQSAGGTTQGNYWCYFWNRVLSAAEVAQLYAEPYAFVEPMVPASWFVMSGGAGIVGSLSATTPAPTSSSTAINPVVGSLSASLTVPALSAVASDPIVGSSSSSLPVPTLASTATNPVVGTSSVTTLAPSVVSVVYTSVVGSGSSAMPVPSAASVLSTSVVGSTSATTPLVTSSSTVVNPVVGSVSATTPSVTLASAAVDPVVGSAGISLLAPTLTASIGNVAVLGDLSASLAGPALTSQITTASVGSLSASFPPPALSSVIYTSVVGSINLTLFPPGVVSVIVVSGDVMPGVKVTDKVYLASRLIDTVNFRYAVADTISFEGE